VSIFDGIIIFLRSTFIGLLFGTPFTLFVDWPLAHLPAASLELERAKCRPRDAAAAVTILCLPIGPAAAAARQIRKCGRHAIAKRPKSRNVGLRRG
jgi:hypothetical protein